MSCIISHRVRTTEPVHHLSTLSALEYEKYNTVSLKTNSSNLRSLPGYHACCSPLARPTGPSHPPPMPLRFTLRQLEYFVAVGGAGSIAAASERVNVSSPSISSAIAQLEAEFGIQLFIRQHAQGLSLTPGGRRFFHEAKLVIEQAEALHALAGDIAGLPRGPIAVGCLVTLAPLVLPALRRGFETSHPEARVRQAEGAQDGAVRDAAPRRDRRGDHLRPRDPPGHRLRGAGGAAALCHARREPSLRRPRQHRARRARRRADGAARPRRQPRLLPCRSSTPAACVRASPNAPATCRCCAVSSPTASATRWPTSGSLTSPRRTAARSPSFRSPAGALRCRSASRQCAPIARPGCSPLSRRTAAPRSPPGPCQV